jgi:hypothetical protein
MTDETSKADYDDTRIPSHAEEKKEEHSGDCPRSNGLHAVTENARQLCVPLQPEASSVKRRSRHNPLVACFHLTVHGILFLISLAFAAIYCLRIIHDDYFVTIVQRARRTDEDLKEEYTYYERDCNVVDITATREEASQLIVKPGDAAISKMMTHGAIMIPQLLPDSMIQELREFVVWKNNAVKGTAAEYPVTEGEHRISYGIEATEHPTVVKALKSIHDNYQLKKILEELVGKNPALTEVTAITAQYGSDYQPWHPDVKPDGNGVQFGRTYSHSYSLFIPLQNTTGEMGATDLCPGTHYCANWIDAQCEQRKIGLHEIREEGVWRAGDAVLFNQQVWHRGTEHTDPNSQDRMVFIMSFIGRPSDTRQLARGTYFHMKWNMWGHTWQDMADAVTSMAHPYNILRCLHLWKPSGRQWGYDLFTSAALRIANNQLGCEPEDLQIFLDVLEKNGFPAWLDGPIDLHHREAWGIYFRETITNIFNFLLKVNCVAIAVYSFVVLVAAVRTKNEVTSVSRVLFRGFIRLCRTYGSVIGLTLFIVHTIRSSPWAVEISSGKTFMRPFPSVDSIWRDDPAVSKGPTTVPMRYDVLVGTRLASKTIGAYSRWHDFHPGNNRFMEYVTNVGGIMYRSYETGLPTLFHETMIDSAIEMNQRENGRFLQQDYRTGDWILMSESETREYVALRLRLGANTFLAALKQELEYLIGDYRFGILRGTALSRISQSYIQEVEQTLFKPLPRVDYSETPKSRLLASATSSNNTSTRFRTPSTFVVTSPSHEKKSQDPRTAQSRYWRTFEKEDLPDLRPLAEVLVRFDFEDGGKELIPATVLRISWDGQAEIAFYGVTAYDFDYNPTMWVTVDKLVPRPQPVAGLPVRGNFLQGGDYFPGTIQLVRPTAQANILYDDGDYEEGVHSDFYETVSEFAVE